MKRILDNIFSLYFRFVDIKLKQWFRDKDINFCELEYLISETQFIHCQVDFLYLLFASP